MATGEPRLNGDGERTKHHCRCCHCGDTRVKADVSVPNGSPAHDTILTLLDQLERDQRILGGYEQVQSPLVSTAAGACVMSRAALVEALVRRGLL